MLDSDLYELAEKLHFELAQSGDCYSLRITTDVSQPIVHKNLTADEVKEILNTWKLRGLHGG